MKTYYHKNEGRNTIDNIPKYIPQYQEKGIEPLIHEYPNQSQNKKPTVEVAHSQENTIIHAAKQRKPIWSGKEYVDDVNFENHNYDGQMIDNNDFITPEAMQQVPPFASSNSTISNEDQTNQKLFSEIEEKNNTNVIDILQNISSDLYLLIVHGIPICSAPLAQIQEEVSDLLFGRHELNKYKTIEEKDIVVIKKCKIKIGVFVED